jgi:hypothetical protein
MLILNYLIVITSILYLTSASIRMSPTINFTPMMLPLSSLALTKMAKSPFIRHPHKLAVTDLKP